MDGKTWQPIETAPRDGSHILLWTDTRAMNAEGVAYVQHFMNGEHSAVAQIGAWADEHWNTEFIGEPTHWMPLPEPPSSPL